MSEPRPIDPGPKLGRSTESTERDPSKMKIYAMLVGINDYQGDIPKLKGCLNDVRRVESYLSKKYGEPNIVELPADGPLSSASGDDKTVQLLTLTDTQATYRNVIRGFREHLRRATIHDTVWFHFSGHGSEQPTAAEFKAEIEPRGKDQTLVCYNGDGNDTTFEGLPIYLADKELAVLLKEVETAGSKAPHIIVTLDSCHSGSGTRQFADPTGLTTRVYRSRNALLEGAQRDLKDYLGGHFQTNELKVPVSKHVAISACEDIETAGDLGEGGIFTLSLLDTLENTTGTVDYANLFAKTRSKANTKRRKQNPQFALIGGFDPYTSFIEGETQDVHSRYNVFKRVSSWYVACGAINGLPADKASETKLVLEADDAKAKDALKALGIDNINASIESVGPQNSKLKLDLDSDQLSKLDGEFVAYILTLPTDPVFVDLTGSGEGINEFKNSVDFAPSLLVSSQNIRIAEDESEKATAYLAVHVADGSFDIREAQTGKRFIQVTQAAGSDLEDRIRIVKDNLIKIVRWKKLIELDNPNSKIKNWVDLNLELFTSQDGQMASNMYSGNEIKIYGSDKNLFPTESSGLALATQMHVTVNHTKQRVFLYGFHIGTDCSVEFFNDEEKDTKDLEKETTLALNSSEPIGWEALEPDQDSDTRWYKLIVTTEELDHHQLLQGPLVGTKGSTISFKDLGKVMNEWYAVTVKLTVVREKNEIAPGKITEIAEGITVMAHDKLSASVSLSTAAAGERSSDPANKLTAFQDMGLEMVGFGSTRDLSTQNVLELTNIQGLEDTDLETDPLEIELSTSINSDEEALLPLAFDGEHFRVIGTSEATGNTTKVKITQLPKIGQAEGNAGEEVPNPFGEDESSRSLFKALKMAFFKIAFKKNDQNELRYVVFNKDGSISQDNAGLKIKAQEAKKILLIVHGIIGNTTKLAESMATLDFPDGKKLQDHYDLVLTYDYENLNTPIARTAEKLKQALAEEAGLTAGHDKDLTILGSSMGGLVSRWFIERDGGSQIASRLIMVGTPNNGSNFGKVEGARKFAITALDMAANYVPDMIPYSGYILKGLKMSAQILTTLGQMDPKGSDFLKELNNSEDPKIPYLILAGDATKYEADGQGFHKFMEKAKISFGDMANKGAHDIAVQVDSIKNEIVYDMRDPKAKVEEVICHHLNYFSSEAGRAGLVKLLQ